MRDKPIAIAWVKRSVLEPMLVEAERSTPYETGGCLMGYWLVPFKEVVITKLIGPGPNAKHLRNKFEPDHEWQAAEIARVYKESGYLYTYLGDWHTHPCSRPSLSWRDRRTLRRIASYPPARAPTPLMGILARNSPWVLKIWCFWLIKFLNISIGSKKRPLKTRIFD